MNSEAQAQRLTMYRGRTIWLYGDGSELGRWMEQGVDAAMAPREVASDAIAAWLKEVEAE